MCLCRDLFSVSAFCERTRQHFRNFAVHVREMTATTAAATAAESNRITCVLELRVSSQTECDSNSAKKNVIY